MWNHYCEVPMSPDKFRASLTTFLVLKTKTKNQSSGYLHLPNRISFYDNKIMNTSSPG